MRGIQLGTYDVNIRNALQVFSGFMQIQKAGYQSNPSLNKNFKLTPEIVQAVKSHPQVKGYSPRVMADGLISFKDYSQGTAIIGLDPRLEKSTTNSIDKIQEGRFFSADSENEIVVGYKLLKNLKAEIGDEVVILAQGTDGALGNLKFKIVGTVKLGSYEFDAMSAFMKLQNAQELVTMYNRVHAIAISLYKLSDIETVRDELESEISNDKIAVLPWQKVMPDFKQSIEFDNVSGIFFLAILIVIVGFGILNTVLMSVTERFNEFGVTLSIGMKNAKLVILVFIEAGIIALLGILIGNAVGVGINYYLVQNPIEFAGPMAELYAEYGFLPVIRSSLDPMIFINNSSMILLISLIACIYPAVKVYMLEPLKGIRYT